MNAWLIFIEEWEVIWWWKFFRMINQRYDTAVTRVLCVNITSVTSGNKCIGDDTKAATRQSLNCIKNKNKIKYGEQRFSYGGWNSYALQCGTIMTLIFRHVTAPCNVACGYGIVTVNSPSGSTLQCDTWLWDDAIEFARWQHPAVWHVALESWHWIHPNVHHIGLLHLVSISTTSPQLTCHSVPVS